VVIAAVVLGAIVGVGAFSAVAVDTPVLQLRSEPRNDDGDAPAAQRRVQPRHDGGGNAPATGRRVQPCCDDGGDAPASGSGEERGRAEAVTPVQVRIPAIDVAAPVIRLGLNDDGSLEVPQAFDEAGWWTGGATPGEPGPAVVVGHVDSHAGPAVFHRLRDLRRGDRIELVGRGGRAVRFSVDRVERHPKDDFPTAAVYGGTPQPTLRLITCGGTFDRSARSYVDNVIVYASVIA
jgi:hypothetical protein